MKRLILLSVCREQRLYSYSHTISPKLFEVQFFLGVFLDYANIWFCCQQIADLSTSVIFLWPNNGSYLLTYTEEDIKKLHNTATAETYCHLKTTSRG
jgi:hypothetical protein